MLVSGQMIWLPKLEGAGRLRRGLERIARAYGGPRRTRASIRASTDCAAFKATSSGGLSLIGYKAPAGRLTGAVSCLTDAAGTT
jgi:hypothetical protein